MRLVKPKWFHYFNFNLQDKVFFNIENCLKLLLDNHLSSEWWLYISNYQCMRQLYFLQIFEIFLILLICELSLVSYFALAPIFVIIFWQVLCITKSNKLSWIFVPSQKVWFVGNNHVFDTSLYIIILLHQILLCII